MYAKIRVALGGCFSICAEHRFVECVYMARDQIELVICIGIID